MTQRLFNIFLDIWKRVRKSSATQHPSAWKLPPAQVVFLLSVSASR